MATTQIVFGKAGYLGSGGVLPVLDTYGLVSETIVPSGSNQQTTLTAPLLGQRPVCVITTDTAIFAVVAENPNATNTSSRVYVPANSLFAVVCNAGDKAAVVTA